MEKEEQPVEMVLGKEMKYSWVYTTVKKEVSPKQSAGSNSIVLLLASVGKLLRSL